MDYSTKFDFMAGDALELTNKFLDEQEKIARDKYIKWAEDNKESILQINSQIKEVAVKGALFLNVNIDHAGINYSNAEKFREYYKNLFYEVNHASRRSGAHMGGFGDPILDTFTLRWGIE